MTDYSKAAELYSNDYAARARTNRYLRFPSVAEAVPFAIEEISGDALRSVSIETADERYEGEAIRALYLAPEYPLERATR